MPYHAIIYKDKPVSHNIELLVKFAQITFYLLSLFCELVIIYPLYYPHITQNLVDLILKKVCMHCITTATLLRLDTKNEEFIRLQHELLVIFSNEYSKLYYILMYLCT